MLVLVELSDLVAAGSAGVGSEAAGSAGVVLVAADFADVVGWPLLQLKAVEGAAAQ